MTLKAQLGSRPVIYEIVPPRRDTSRFSTELRGVEEVMSESRIAAINIPELIKRRVEKGEVTYSPATIPPEEYAMMIKDYKESIVNIIAPRLDRDALLRRARKALNEYKIPNLILVGRERREDRLPGPDVMEAISLISPEKDKSAALGGICIFTREASGVDAKGASLGMMTEPKRVWLKGKAGCDFVTSQIVFEPTSPLKFLRAYHEICNETGDKPLTVFVSLTTVPTSSILSLLETLDVEVPSDVRSRLTGSPEMGAESLKIAVEVIQELVSGVEREGIEVPLGIQIEQVGVNSGELSLRLLDAAYPLSR